jgi:transcriptional regulator with XRE-family HTH domain
MEFGEVLQRIREAHGLSQVKLAERAGTNRSVISKYERGKRVQPPNRRTVNRLILALKATRLEEDELLLSAGFTPHSISVAQWKQATALVVSAQPTDDARVDSVS